MFVGYEIELYSRQLQLPEERGPQAFNQLKRSLVERTRAVTMITNISVVGLLVCAPLTEKLDFLVREIENFTKITAGHELTAAASPSTVNSGSMQKHYLFQDNSCIVRYIVIQVCITLVDIHFTTSLLVCVRQQRNIFVTSHVYS